MTNCPICGNKFDDFSLTKPKTYCSDECKNYNKFKNALERVLLKLRPTKEAKKLIKGDLFRLSNILRNGTDMTQEKNND